MTKLFPLAALLALAAAHPALAQVPRVPATPAAPQTGSVSDAGQRVETLPPPSVPGHPGGYTDKHLGGTSGPTFPNGVPVRDIDAGNSRAAQPRSGQAMPGAQPTKSIFRSRKQRGQ